MNMIPNQLERNFYHILQFPKMFLQATTDKKITNKLLLIGTIGRKTGNIRVTPLQYEYFKNHLYLGSMRGKKSDWVKNIKQNPKIYVQISKKKRFVGLAKIIDNPEVIMLFLKLRISRNPRMIPFILSVAGIRDINDTESLSKYTKEICLVRITIKNQL